MSAHLWSSEIDEFLALVLASHLVATGDLQRHVEAFQRTTAGKGTLDALCEHFVSHRVLTQWQCDQLREGKYRGFFLDDYRITEFLRTDETRDKYLAEESKTGQRVLLEVTSPSFAPIRNGRPQYRVSHAPGVRHAPKDSDREGSPLGDPRISVLFNQGAHEEPESQHFSSEALVERSTRPPGSTHQPGQPEEPEPPPSIWLDKRLWAAAAVVLVAVSFGASRYFQGETAEEHPGAITDVMRVGATAGFVERAVTAHRGDGAWNDSRVFDDKTAKVRYNLGSGQYLVVAFDELYDPPGNIVPNDKVSSFEFVHFDDLREEIDSELVPFTKQVHLASLDGWNLAPIDLIRAVNTLQGLGKEQALDVLRAYNNVASYDDERAWQYDLDANRAVLIARLLFVPDADAGDMAVVKLGTRSMAIQSGEGGAKQFPVIVADDIPFSMLGAHGAVGGIQSVSQFLSFCDYGCTLRRQPLMPVSSPVKTVDRICASPRWRKLLGGKFHLARSLLRVQAVRCLESALEDVPDNYVSQLNPNVSGNMSADATWRSIRRIAAKQEVHWDRQSQEFRTR